MEVIKDSYDHCSLPTCISSSVILLWRPNSCCWRAVFYPFREVICCWIRLFSAFWKLKCRFLYHGDMYISSSMRTSSFDKLFLTSAVFMVRTDSRVSFSLRRICTSFLWLLSSFEMFLIWFCFNQFCTSRVWSLPLREAGLEPKLFPVSFMELYIILINKCRSNWEPKKPAWASSDPSCTPSKASNRMSPLTQRPQRWRHQTQ